MEHSSAEPQEKATPVCCQDLRGVRSVVQESQTALTCRGTPYPPALEQLDILALESILVRPKPRPPSGLFTPL